MRDILEKYLDTEIGINYEKPFKIEEATLIGLYDNYFSISDHKNAYTHYFSYQSIVQIIEHEGGVDAGGLFTHTKRHIVVVKVGHLIEYVPA